MCCFGDFKLGLHVPLEQWSSPQGAAIFITYHIKQKIKVINIKITMCNLQSCHKLMT